MKSKILVFMQFFIIFLMTFPLGTETTYFELGLFFMLLGLVVGVAALSKNRLGNFNIRPDIKEGCTLVTDGIYAYIRHPMYTAVLLGMFGFMLLYFSNYELVLFCLLFVNLLLKMFYEESLWKNCSAEYQEYSRKTARLIPFIF